MPHAKHTLSIQPTGSQSGWSAAAQRKLEQPCRCCPATHLAWTPQPLRTHCPGSTPRSSEPLLSGKTNHHISLCSQQRKQVNQQTLLEQESLIIITATIYVPDTPAWHFTRTLRDRYWYHHFTEEEMRLREIQSNLPNIPQLLRVRDRIPTPTYMTTKLILPHHADSPRAHGQSLAVFYTGFPTWLIDSDLQGPERLHQLLRCGHSAPRHVPPLVLWCSTGAHTPHCSFASCFLWGFSKEVGSGARRRHTGWGGLLLPAHFPLGQHSPRNTPSLPWPQGLCPHHRDPACSFSVPATLYHPPSLPRDTRTYWCWEEWVPFSRLLSFNGLNVCPLLPSPKGDSCPLQLLPLCLLHLQLFTAWPRIVYTNFSVKITGLVPISWLDPNWHKESSTLMPSKGGNWGPEKLWLA